MKSSTFQGVVRWKGGTMVLHQGKRFNDDHPLVTERPELFEDGDSQRDVVGGPDVVETATQAPGELRQTPATGPRGGTTRVARTQVPGQ